MRRNIFVWSRGAALGGLLLLAACSSRGGSAAAPDPSGGRAGLDRLEIRDELKLGVVRHSRERAREIARGKGTRAPGRRAEGLRGGGTDQQ